MDVHFCRMSRLWYNCSLYEADILLWKRAFTSMQSDALYSLAYQGRNAIYMHSMYY